MEKRRSGLWSVCLRTLNKARLLIPLLPKLGFTNVANVAGYRLALGSRLIEKAMPARNGYYDPLFHGSYRSSKDSFCTVSESTVVDRAEDQLKGSVSYFSDQKYNIGSPPDWFLNPINQKRYPDANLHWSRLPDFSNETGDIKIIWEVSRFDWALVYARAYRVTGDERYISALNKWSSDWTEKNPLNRGPNWKCGQEAAIRMLQTLLSAFLLNQHKSPAPGLIRFILEHCMRIKPTLRYAIAQNNNHGVSEGAALFIGGAWIEMIVDDPKVLRNARHWTKKGRKLLEDCATYLIGNDGSFSQYSINYHRLMLDMLSMVEFWRRQLNQPAFSASFYKKTRAVTNWLNQMTDPLTGDAPNLGANDGARLFVLTDTTYRDYRPSIQLASVLFFNCRTYGQGAWDDSLHWLGLDNIFEKKTDHSKSCVFSDGGYTKLTTPDNKSWGVIRFPRFHFRPGHADLLHFDLWHKGINLIRDGGSYSYNADNKWLEYFPGTASHNTIQFDKHDQMPRAGRFLFSVWPKGTFDKKVVKDNGCLSWSASYQDFYRCWHKRTIKAANNVWEILDEIDGFENEAVLRWRLFPDKWILDKNICTNDRVSVEVTTDNSSHKISLVDGWESRHYMEKTSLPVLEAWISKKPTRIITIIRLKI